MHKTLIFIVSYNAEKHIESLLKRIKTVSPELSKIYDYEILLIDDASKDNTVLVASEYKNNNQVNLTIFKNPINQGYGGNQKIGYQYAIKYGFDSVILLHGDAQYPPEMIKPMIDRLVESNADLVLGSRMLNKKDALKGGMPVYKFLGNIIVTKIQNLLLDTKLSEFHTGFKAYRVSTLKTLPFSFNSNDFDFDTDIIIQHIVSKAKISEVAIPTHYGDEECNVNGYKYAWQVIRNSFLAKVQKYAIYYHPKFDFAPEERYESKVNFDSSHKFAIENIAVKSDVLEICGSSSYVADELKKNKHCNVTSIQINDNSELPQISGNINTILFLDVLENMSTPENLLIQIRERFSGKNVKVVVTVSNVGFILMRLSLLLGNFSYGKRGILDSTHKRLFTFYSLKRLFKMHGYNIEKIEGIPIPFELIFKNKNFAKICLKINRLFMKISQSLFSFEIAMVVRPLPTLDILVDNAKNQ